MEEKTLKNWSEFRPTIDEINMDFMSFPGEMIVLKGSIMLFYFGDNGIRAGN
jgi:hypothetical protein